MQRSIVVEVLETVFVRFLVKSVNLIFFVVLARMLDMESMAVYGFFFSTVMISAVFIDGGMRNLIVREAASGWGGSELLRFVHVSFSMYFLVFVLLFLLYFFVAPVGRLDGYLIPFLISALGMAYIRTSQGFLLAKGRVREFNFTEAVPRAVLLLSLVFVLLGVDVTVGYAIATLSVAQVLGALYCSYLVFSDRVVEESSFCRDKSYRSMLLGAAMFMLAVVAMGVNRQLHFYVVDYFNPSESGVFFTFFRYSEVLTEVALGVSVVLVSKVVGESDNALSNAARMARFTYALFFPVLVIFLLLSDYVFDVLMVGVGGEYLLPFCLTVIASYLGVLWVMIFPTLAVLISPLALFGLFLMSMMVSVFVYGLADVYCDGIDAFVASVAYLCCTILLNFSFLVIANRRFGVAWCDFIFLSRSDLSSMRKKLGF